MPAALLSRQTVPCWWVSPTWVPPCLGWFSRTWLEDASSSSPPRYEKKAKLNIFSSSQLGMAVSHLGLGLYFHHLTGMRREEDEESGGNDTSVTGRGNVTGSSSWSKEDLGLVGWLPLPLVLSFTVTAILLFELLLLLNPKMMYTYLV